MDFLAEGTLIILINKATKLFDRFQSLDKKYTACFKLGMVTETWDLEGRIVQTKPVGLVTRDQLQEAAFSLKGEIVQMPPVFSSKKISGKPAYYYARNDTKHEKLKKLKASNISIYDIKINSFDGLDGNISICCSSGTYVRSIVNDIGNILGCGATLTHLTRDSIGKFELKDSIDADDIEKISVSIENNVGGDKKIAQSAKRNDGDVKENDDGDRQNTDIQNIVQCRAGIFSIEKILQLKYL